VGSTSSALSSSWTTAKNFRRSRGGKAFTCSNTSFALMVEKYHGPYTQRKFGFGQLTMDD
jgi:hypothetical protein